MHAGEASLVTEQREREKGLNCGKFDSVLSMSPPSGERVGGHMRQPNWEKRTVPTKSHIIKII